MEGQYPDWLKILYLLVIYIPPNIPSLLLPYLSFHLLHTYHIHLYTMRTGPLGPSRPKFFINLYFSCHTSSTCMPNEGEEGIPIISHGKGVQSFRAGVGGGEISTTLCVDLIFNQNRFRNAKFDL